MLAGVSRFFSLRTAVLLVLAAVCGCQTTARRRPTDEGRPPTFLLGEFVDDYGARFTIDARDFVQQPRNTFHIVRWEPQQQYLIARNDAANSSAANQWTRIDWMRLDGMAPYTWAFCFSAYDAPTAAAAEAVDIARRVTPRTGCNGYPFTRMRVR